MFGDAAFKTTQYAATPTGTMDDFVTNCASNGVYGTGGTSASYTCADTCAGHPTASDVSIPAYGGSSKDSWKWTIPFDTCGVTGEKHEVTTVSSEEYYWYYDLHFNSNTEATNFAGEPVNWWNFCW